MAYSKHYGKKTAKKSSKTKGLGSHSLHYSRNKHIAKQPRKISGYKSGRKTP